ncbi:MAG: hypothetical protein WC026_11065 [Hyphomicrobium sp.]|uniref:hypothetical protein n=1 Tax=Hyphomicrobium sp. TaxID=82 RepID=UPI003568936C
MNGPKWAAWPKRNRDGSPDRLARWIVVDENSPGRGKEVIAENIRTEANARALASGREARAIIRDLCEAADALGCYEGSSALYDAVERGETWLKENGIWGV